MKLFIHFWFEAMYMKIGSEIDHKHTHQTGMSVIQQLQIWQKKKILTDFKAQKMSTSVTTSQK
jgi:hypothetical protein